MTARPAAGDEPRPRAGDAGAATCPNDGTAEAAAVERARKGMLHEGRDLKRTRIGADVLCEALLRQGVDVFFSYPGGVILPLYDILGDYPELRHVLVRHEQGGAHAADGYARVTGRVGVCMGTSGPGATNLVTGIGTALAGLRADGRDHRQRARRPDRQGRVPGDRHQRHHAADDQAQLPGPRRRRPAARRRRGVPHRPDRPARARSTSTSPRTPSSRRRAPTHPDARTRSSPGCPASGPNIDGHPRQLKLAAAEIAAAKRPVILAGHGVLHAEAWDELRRVRREDPDPGRLDAARASAPSTRRIRWPTATWACTAGSTSTGRSRAADLLIAIGMRFDDRVTGNVRTYAPYARIIHADIDPAEIGKNVAVEVPDRGRREARPRRP